MSERSTAALRTDGHARSDACGRALSPPAPRTSGRLSRTPDRLYDGRRQPTREVTRQHVCPTCGAAPGAPCQGRRGPRKSNHLERVEVALGLRAEPELQATPRSLLDGDGRPAVKPPQAATPEGLTAGRAEPDCRALGVADPR